VLALGMKCCKKDRACPARQWIRQSLVLAIAAISIAFVCGCRPTRFYERTEGALMLHKPLWSPDGKSVAVIGDAIGKRNTSVCIVADVASGKAKEVWRVKLESSAAAPNSLAYPWSADSLHLAFVGPETGNRGSIAVVSSEGRLERLLFVSPPPISWAKWSPSGKELAYISADASVHVVSAADGTALLHVDKNRVGPSLDVTWDPSGRYLVLAPGMNQLCRVDIRTGSVSEMVELGSQIKVGAWRWISNDKIAFCTTDNLVCWHDWSSGKTQVVLQALPLGKVETLGWDISPDGALLVLGVTTAGITSGQHITKTFICELATRKLTDLGFYAREPSWSPDGNNLVMRRERGVWLWDARSGESRPLLVPMRRGSAAAKQ